MDSELLPWQEKALPMLGKQTDKVIGKACGVCFMSVRKLRWKLGVPPLRRSKEWQGKALPMLGKLPDRIVGEQVGRATETIRRYREALAIPAMSRRVRLGLDLMAQLGTKPDRVLAREANVAISTVQRRRLQRNIPAYRTSRREHDNYYAENPPLDRPARQKGQAEKTARAPAPLRDAAA